MVGGTVAVGLALAFSRGIVGPIGALTNAARRLEGGDLSQRVVVGSRDEIGQLGHAFNAMADGLARNEQLRRNLVTDVAHELRTPLRICAGISRQFGMELRGRGLRSSTLCTRRRCC